ncbi:MAG TPA: hypothetical protein VHL52_08020 [Acidimicrobiia bacterium]|nr:hypothetical protein [Acidimicrobiia bacterium]
MHLDDRLRAHMEAQMAAAPSPDLGDVMERGDTIRRRRRLLATGLPVAAAVVIVTGMVVAQQRPNDPESSVDEAVADNAELSMDVGALDWATEPADLGWSRQSLSSDGVLFALSTAPGARWENFPNGNIPQAIYTSTDGSTWASHPVGGSWVSAIAAADGLLYAVGTAPGAEADSVAVQVGISEDQGDTFESVTLPIQRTGPGVFDTDVIAAGDGVLALAMSRTSLDPASLLPAGTLDGTVEPVILEEGIAVVPIDAAERAYETCFGGDAARCQEVIDHDATFYASWDELGVEAENVAFGETVEYSAFWAGNGRDFDEVDYPFPDGFVEQVFQVGRGAVAAVSTQAGTQLFASDDARNWRRVAADVPVGFVRSAGLTADGVVVVSQPPNGQGVSVFRAPDLSGPWAEVSVADLLPEALKGQNAVWIGAAAVGEGGVAVSLSIEQAVPVDRGGNPISQLADEFLGRDGVEPAAEFRPVGALLVSKDLNSWSLLSTADLGDFVDFLMFGPDGNLIAQATKSDNGRPVRVQAIATP